MKKTQLVTSALILVITLSLLITISIAWFASNQTVNTNGLTVSIDSDVEYELASEGDTSILTNEEAQLDFVSGEQVVVGEKTVYKTNSSKSKIQLRVNEHSSFYNQDENDNELSPGSYGKLTFYIIPKTIHTESRTVQVNISLGCFEKNGAESVVSINDEALQRFMEGHILLFSSFDGTHYSGWIDNNTISVQIDANEAYKQVDVFWVWNMYFESFLQDTGEVKSLCATSTDANSDFRRIISDLQANEDKYLSYNESDGLPALIDGEEFVNLSAYSLYYNRADEYIGKNCQYVMMEISVQ